MSYTTTEFLDSVKVRGAIPTSQNTFTVARILNLGDAELRSYILPLVMKAREFYYAFDVSTAINTTGVYDIHTRAVGGKVTNACLTDADTRLDLNWISEEELSSLTNTQSGKPGVYIKRSQLVVVPADVPYTYFKQTILLRPGKFVATTAAAQITAINTSTKTLSFTSGTVPTTWTTANLFDLIQAQPHFDHLAIDQVVTSITTTAIIFSSTLPTRLAVGDWVSLAGESPIIQVPVELQPLLEQKTANTCMRAQGDEAGLKSGEEELTRMQKETWNLYQPRIEDEGKKIVIRSGILRRV